MFLAACSLSLPATALANSPQRRVALAIAPMTLDRAVIALARVAGSISSVLNAGCIPCGRRSCAAR